jgi:PAS domain-containing protein
VINGFKNGSIKNLEIYYQHADGKITPVEINADVVQTKEGKVVVTLCRDITESKQAEEVLAASEDRIDIKVMVARPMTAGGQFRSGARQKPQTGRWFQAPRA